MRKAFEKQTEKQVGAITSLDTSNKLKQFEGISPQNLTNDLIRAKLKEIVKLQDIIKKDDLTLNQNAEKLVILVIFTTYSFLSETHEGYLSLQNADLKQSDFAIELKNFEKSAKTLEIFFKKKQLRIII